MPDQSHLDSQYFVDGTIYNCPFCNRRHVSYLVLSTLSFDWTESKVCKAYVVRCSSCKKRSLHLTFEELSLLPTGAVNNRQAYSFSEPGDDASEDWLDEAFFYSVPTSFFALDDRIPRVLRDLLTEAEGCLKSNFLTGASACARKIVYELAVLSKGEGASYEDRIKSLKAIHTEVEPTFFDTLLTIQELTSTKVHENAFDGWDARHLRVMLKSLSDVLHEIYVVPALRADRRKAILELKEQLMPRVRKPKGDG
jgi:hypothetical protein